MFFVETFFNKQIHMKLPLQIIVILHILVWKSTSFCLKFALHGEHLISGFTVVYT